jgi:hypothetical protein
MRGVVGYNPPKVGGATELAAICGSSVTPQKTCKISTSAG